MGKLVVGALITLGLVVLLINMAGHKAAIAKGGRPVVANESAAAQTVRFLVTSQGTYSAQYPATGFAPSLAALGPGDSSPCQPQNASSGAACIVDDKLLAGPQCTGDTWCSKSGYKFRVSCLQAAAPCNEYVIAAAPEDAATGGRSFCALSDGVLRFSPNSAVAPDFTAEQCRQWSPV